MQSIPFCPYCFTALAEEDTSETCPACGADLGQYHCFGISYLEASDITNSSRTYHVGIRLGHSRFNHTFLGMEDRSGQKVAIKAYYPERFSYTSSTKSQLKVCSKHYLEFQLGMKSFLQEADALTHQGDLPTVAHVRDYFAANGTAFMVMDYLGGTSLRKQLDQENGALPAQELIDHMRPLIRDLADLHQRGILHHDISPDCLYWMPDGLIRITDFGGARYIQNGKAAIRMIKEHFAPIETYLLAEETPRTDIYSLAAVLYYCITGILPPTAMERKYGRENLKSPISLCADITPAQEHAILWALSLQPEDRPQSMADFYKALYGKFMPAYPDLPLSQDRRSLQEDHNIQDKDKTQDEIQDEDESKKPSGGLFSRLKRWKESAVAAITRHPRVF